MFSMKLYRIFAIIKRPQLIALKLLRYLSCLFSDEAYIKAYYYFNMGKRIDLINPKSYNEKLNWLKLYYHHPDYTNLVDKFLVKEYVSKTIGNKYIIPTIGQWASTDDIDWECLPNKFVLKTTHGGGNTGVIICKDSKKFDRKSAILKLNKALKQDLYKSSREWPYKNVRRQIIAEPYVEDEVSGELRDYKLFCFNGEVKFLFVASERQRKSEPYFDFFDSEYNYLKIRQKHPNSIKIPPKPQCFTEMIEVAEKLSSGMPHVRVDLYEVNGHVLFGELTFYHFGGVVPFDPEEWDFKFGEYLNLPNEKILA